MLFLLITIALIGAAVALVVMGPRLLAPLPLALAVGWSLWSSAWIIPEGMVGATSFLGDVEPDHYEGGTGLILTNPLTERRVYDARTQLLLFRGEDGLEMTLGRGGVFIMEAGLPWRLNGVYAPELLARTGFSERAAAINAIRAGFRDVAQRYDTYETFSRRRQGLDEFEGLPPVEQEIQTLAQEHIDRFFFEASGIERRDGLPVIAVGPIQIRAVIPSPQVQAAANEFEAELTALKTARVQRERAALEAERVTAIVPALEAIANIIPPGQSAEGFASAVNAAAQLRLTEAQARAFAATADAMADPGRRITPTIILGGGAGGPQPVLPLGSMPAGQ
ncbi:MAG: hypothetical protein AAF899_18565 [Pseudomonadota bacterium]